MAFRDIHCYHYTSCVRQYERQVNQAEPRYAGVLFSSQKVLFVTSTCNTQTAPAEEPLRMQSVFMIKEWALKIFHKKMMLSSNYGI